MQAALNILDIVKASNESTTVKDTTIYGCLEETTEINNFVRFENCTFDGVSFSAVHRYLRFSFSNCIFKNCNFSFVKFYSATIKNCTFQSCKSEDVAFNDCILDYTVFKDCTINFTVFYLCSMQSSSIVASDFSDTTLDYCAGAEGMVFDANTLPPEIDPMGFDVDSYTYHNLVDQLSEDKHYSDMEYGKDIWV